VLAPPPKRNSKKTEKADENYSAIWNEIEEKERKRVEKQAEFEVEEPVKLDDQKQSKVDERYA